MRNLPTHTYRLGEGLVTNVEYREQRTLSFLTADNVDSFGRFNTISKLPGSTVVSPDLGGSVVSLHYFEYTDLTFTRQRAVLALANGAIRNFVSTSSWGTPSLPSGATLTNEALTSETMLDRIHLTSTNQRGLPTGGLKYDGTRLTNWGVAAPGTTETQLEALDDSTNWTAGTDTTDADNSSSIDGGGSVEVDKTGTAGNLATISRGSLSHDVSGAGSDQGFIYIFLPSGVLQDLENSEWTSGVDTAAVEIRVTDNASSVFTNSAYYAFSKGDLVPGWNLLSFLWDTPSATTGSGWTTASSIGSIQLQYRTESSATTVDGVLWDNLYITDEGAPTTADAGSGSGPDGTYTYRITYLTEYGLQSNAGPASTSLTVTDNTINLTAIPTSSDAQVIARRIYRDISGDGIFRFVAQIDDNTTTTYSDSVADASLGTAQPPIAGDSFFDNSPPGRLSDTVIHENRIVGIDADNPSVLKISETLDPEAFKIIDTLSGEEAFIGLEQHAFGTMVYATDKSFLLQGDGLNTPFILTPTSPEVGLNGFRSVVRVKGVNFIVREREVYLVPNPNDPWLINGQILDQFAALTNANLADAHIVSDRSRYRVVFFFPQDDKIFIWQYGTKGFQQITGDGSGTDPQDVRVGAWYTMSLPSGLTPQCSEMVERTADLPELWIGADDNRVYHLQDSATNTWANGASTESITVTLKTQAVPMSETGAGRGEPRFLRIDQEASGSVTWTVTVNLLRDPESTASDFSVANFNVTIAGNESVIIPVPTQGTGHAEWVNFQMTTTSDQDIKIRGLELAYIPRGDFVGTRS